MENYNFVLIIEDDMGRMRLCRETFRELNPPPQVTEVDNLSDALKALRDRKYDFYFCDCDFPLVPKTEDPKFNPKKGAFFDFYERLSVVHPDANVVVCSNLYENVRRAKDLGLTAYLKGEKSLYEIITGKSIDF